MTHEVPVGLFVLNEYLKEAKRDSKTDEVALSLSHRRWIWNKSR